MPQPEPMVVHTSSIRCRWCRAAKEIEYELPRSAPTPPLATLIVPSGWRSIGGAACCPTHADVPEAVLLEERS